MQVVWIRCGVVVLADKAVSLFFDSKGTSKRTEYSMGSGVPNERCANGYSGSSGSSSSSGSTASLDGVDLLE